MLYSSSWRIESTYPKICFVSTLFHCFMMTFVCKKFFPVFNEECVSGAYSFVCKKLRVDYGILYVCRVTAGAVKDALPICGFLVLGSKDFALSYLN